MAPPDQDLSGEEGGRDIVAAQPPRDHDRLPIAEILARLDDAEAMIQQARGLLDAPGQSLERPGEPASIATSATEPSVQGNAGSNHGEFDSAAVDPVLLARYAPAGPQEDYRAAVAALFRLALDPPSDQDALAFMLGRLLHSEAVSGEKALRLVMSFPWKRFVRFLDHYLVSAADPYSFHIVRTRPADPAGAVRIKAYLQAKGRGPAPIDLARDPACEGSWRVVAFSL